MRPKCFSTRRTVTSFKVPTKVKRKGYETHSKSSAAPSGGSGPRQQVPAAVDPPPSPPSSRALLAGPGMAPADNLPVRWSGPQFPRRFGRGSVVKRAPCSRAASSARWGPGFLSRSPRPGSPPPALAAWRTFPRGCRGEVRGAVFDPPGSPRVTFPPDSRWRGRGDPSLAVCFAGPCASPSVSGAHRPFFRVFGRKLFPWRLSSFVAAALKKKLGLLLQGAGARSGPQSLGASGTRVEFYVLRLTRNLGARHSGRQPHSQGCHLARHRRCDRNPVAGWCCARERHPWGHRGGPGSWDAGMRKLPGGEGGAAGDRSWAGPPEGQAACRPSTG